MAAWECLGTKSVVALRCLAAVSGSDTAGHFLGSDDTVVPDIAPCWLSVGRF